MDVETSAILIDRVSGRNVHNMHIHILGVCGTFMGSLAVLAKQLGYHVTGSDQNVYPPMSTQLEEQGIELIQGYDPEQLNPAPDLVVIGNAMSRGNPCVEYVLANRLKYTSGPQWLAEHVLQGRWVLAVAGTHGKTSTSSMLTWILEKAGLNPGYLIGGVPKNFDVSARIGGEFFVVEADEYDSAFFDKRSKFVHYKPKTLIMNNLEFDHADIFENLEAIQKQFHHVVRTVPQNGLLIYPEADQNLDVVIDKGCWTPIEKMASLPLGSTPTDHGDDELTLWYAEPLKDDASEFQVYYRGKSVGVVDWYATGHHNMFNGLAAIAASHHVGIEPADAIAALNEFKGIKRRLEHLGIRAGVDVFDDFAHHPTAIATTLEGVRARVALKGESQRVIAVIEPRSNTMRMGCHQSHLAQCTEQADQVFWYQPQGLDWSLEPIVEQSAVPARLVRDINQLVSSIVEESQTGDQVIIMSNGGFGGIHQKLLDALNDKETD